MAGHLVGERARIGENMASMEHEPSITELLDLSGRTAIVTGACGHLGSAMARGLSEAGARVIVTSRDVRRAEESAASLADPHSVGHHGLRLDQTNEKSIASCIEAAVKISGHIDILVNNARVVRNTDES